MEIEFDEAKRQWTLAERRLDFADAVRVFSGDHFDLADDRFDYDEWRILTFGELEGRPVAIVWSPRGTARRIVSMRHVHGKELENRRRALD